MRVLFDTNVILDVVLERVPFYQSSALALSKASSPRLSGLVSVHAIPTIAYIVRRTRTAKDVRRILESLLSGLGVAAVTEAGIRRALISRLADFEDAVTLAAAEECQANYIVTRNTRDFARSSVRAILPEIFLET
jgi:predicted nucleic acid-binding protein